MIHTYLNSIATYMLKTITYIANRSRVLYSRMAINTY
jgi:hypothetical protein